MRADEIARLLAHRPFDPLALFMSDGSDCPVERPGQIILTPRAAYIGACVDGKSRIAQDVVICDLVHVTRLGPVGKRSETDWPARTQRATTR